MPLSRPIQSKTPEKSPNANLNNSMSQSRRSRIFNQSGSKYLSPPKPAVEAPIRKSKYESAYR